MMKVDSAPIHSYQTRIDVSVAVDGILKNYAQLASKVVRVLFAKSMAGEVLGSLKKAFLKIYGITARQFNACRVQVEGKIESVRQLNGQRIKDLRECIEKTKKKISKNRGSKHWWHCQRLKRFQKKLRKLEEDQASGKVRICFGSRKSFSGQFTGEQSHEEWKREWKEGRNKEFFVLGSKDETSGNQSCVASVCDDGSISLRLRLPDALDSGKYIEFHNIRFGYGHEVVLSALTECQIRNDLAKQKDPSYREHGQALCWRFVRDKKGWTVTVSTALPKPSWITNRNFGSIGVDINTDHLAVVEVDRYGNPISKISIPLPLYGKSQTQARALIGDACAQIVEIAAKAKKPLIVEELDFDKKKLNLREMQPGYARMLSSFAYSLILQTLRSRAYRKGVELYSINPAFTSLIGRIKYATRYGLTVHQAAALCIARRFHGFSELLPSQSSVPDGKGGHIAFPVPVRNRGKHEWQHLKVVARKLRAALVEHFRVTLGQSISPPKGGLCDEHSSKFVGAIPTRESLAELLGQRVCTLA